MHMWQTAPYRRRSRRDCTWSIPLVAAALAFVPATPRPLLAAQGVTQRTPNIEDGWAVRPGVVQFNFLHRFNVSDPPARKVSNFPTFNLATGIASKLAFGVKYSTNSTVFAGIPNEYEAWLRALLLRQEDGAPLDAAVTAAYNVAAQSGDAELTVGRELGPLRLLATGRGMSSGYTAGETLFGAGGGAVLRINRWLGVAGDVFRILNDDEEGTEGEEQIETAWGAALQIGIPYTPHTLSLQVVNTSTGSIQGSSRGGDEVLFGFEFTIPITLSRYFGERERTDAAADTSALPRAPAPDSAGGAPVQEVAPAAEPTAAAPAGDSLPPTPPPAVGRAPDEAVRQPAPAPAPLGQPAPPPAPLEQPAPPSGAVKEARIVNFAFPSDIRVETGSRVRWVNGDQVQHTVTAADGSFASSLIEPGKSYERTFDTAGTYAYFCTPHPFMKGKVVVE